MSGRFRKFSSYRGGFRARTSGYRPAFNKRSYKRKSMVTKVKRVVRSLEESKWYGGFYAQAPSQTTTGLTLLNAVGLGQARSLRLGNQITIDYIELRTQIGPNGAVGPVATVVRDILIWDSAPNGVIMPPAQIFADGTQANWYLSPLDSNYVGPRQRYHVLFDRTTTLETEVGTASPNVVQSTRVASKFFRPQKFIQFNDGNTGTVTDMIKNGLYHVSTSNQATAGAPFVNVEYKIKFKDA